MTADAASSINRDERSSQRQRWETPVLREIPVGQRTDAGKAAAAVETATNHSFGFS